MSKLPPGDLSLTAFAPIVWGSTYLVTTQFLPEDRPLLAATVRALPAGLLLMLVTQTRPHGIWWLRAVVLGGLNIGLFFFLLFVAAYELPGGVAALVMSVQPLFVLLLGAVLLGARIRASHVIACAMGALGVGLLVLRSEATLTTVGVLAGLGGALSMAAGIVLTKRWGRPPGTGLLGFTGVQLALGGALLLPAMVFFEGMPPKITGTNVAGFSYLAVVGALIAYTVWFRGIERLPALVVSFLGFFSPLTAAILGFVFLNQSLTVVQIAGAVLIVASIVVAQRAPSSSGRPPPRSAVPFSSGVN
ncbi:EamA family transporter [Aeromicrobium sp.]|uniref:EamA family transporter n=1 Tax=Aeromicrobium sp. TaxID=1871063 RepID=UPI0019C0B13B|nr:EamA family transporter [Aeromicrobium sp.]MBC7631520.1 EamA family transporter [Aeromicrobium sp.]